MADMNTITIEDCLRLYQAGLTAEICDGEVIGFNNEGDNDNGSDFN